MRIFSSILSFFLACAYSAFASNYAATGKDFEMKLLCAFLWFISGVLWFMSAMTHHKNH